VTSHAKLYIKPESQDLIDDSESDENEIPDGSLCEHMKQIRNRLQRSYNCYEKISLIHVNENSIVESILQWIKNVDDQEILKIPCINFMIEE
jgi:hypothetical protein